MTTVLPQQKEQHGGGTYTFSSRPRAVQQRKKYRDAGQGQDSAALYGNIMYDRRIVRGNTYAQHTLPATAQPDPIEIQRQQEARRRAIARKRAKEQLRPRSPEAVEGRKHIDVQTELYLEELTDRVEEADVETQTDTFLDRPPSPLFIPAKTGKDVATQIYEGDLFDFDIEVKPILEVLVGKTIEQALLEVMEEEELANLRAQQREFEELRNAELVETQRLEEQERRHREEKERRMKQQREVLRKEKETAEKIAARAFAQSYLADLIPSVFGTLADNGYFFDPVERDVESGFMPWLMETVEKAIDKSVLGRTMVDVLIREVVAQRMESFEALQRSIQEMSGGAAPVAKPLEMEAPSFIAEAAPPPEETPAEVPSAEEAPATEGEGEGEQAEEPEGGEDEGEPAEEGGDDAPGEA
ncbi:radial spoke head protein 3 homolog isoform X1 [Branchiostoma floridae]|uniref:Radial spoke head protein 3 homolog isoform X1 n=1 Tax=Branchiostoma floridae TaxID=7739 RepID=A0A9J7LQR8_BRAFL|nr:radial spoke head protein 3 homolog isoform X1 [Branchiostoma floridae]